MARLRPALLTDSRLARALCCCASVTPGLASTPIVLRSSSDEQQCTSVCRAKQAEVERIAAAEQQADQQLMEAAMRKDAQEEAADKRAKAERKAEQLRYRSAQHFHHKSSTSEQEW